MGMDQYLLIQFLVGWTSIYQLFWCSPGVQGFDTLPYGAGILGCCEIIIHPTVVPPPDFFFKCMWPQICVNSLRNPNFCVSHCGEEKTSDSNTLISCTCMFILMVQVPVYLGQHCTFQTLIWLALWTGFTPKRVGYHLGLSSSAPFFIFLCAYVFSHSFSHGFPMFSHGFPINKCSHRWVPTSISLLGAASMSGAPATVSVVFYNIPWGGKWAIENSTVGV